MTFENRMVVAKYHATGNDFLVLRRDDFAQPPAEVIGALCDRHRGVGADGLIVLGPPGAGADCTMILCNADGGRAEMSGNGIRCLAHAAAEQGLGRVDELTVATDAGIRSVAMRRDAAGVVVGATVDMGAVTFDPALIPVDAASALGLSAVVHGTEYEGDAAGMGNPHFVVFVDDVASARVQGHGPRLASDPRFVQGANVEFVSVRDDVVSMRVWERGVGETLSCGTGACAAAAVANRRELVGERVRVEVRGGELSVELGETILLGGPVVKVFDVEVDVEHLVSGGAGS